MDSLTSDAFRRWYESRNLTQKQVAGLLGIGQRRVSDMATGRVPVSRQTERQAHALTALSMRAKKDMLTLSKVLDVLCEDPKPLVSDEVWTATGAKP